MPQPLALAPLALLVAVLTWPGAARAADDDCHCELRADIRLDGDAVELRDDDARYRLEGDRVFRDGRELRLDAGQRRAADDYRRGLQLLVPAVSEVVIDGAMLGLEAVTVTFAALGGDRHDLRQYEKRMTTLSEHIHARYNGRELLRGSFGDDADDAGVDAEIDALAEDLAADMTSNIASIVFTALLHPSRIEARADATERIVERRIQPKADALEAKARPLCAQFARLDALERTLGIDAIEVRPGASTRKPPARRGLAFSF